MASNAEINNALLNAAKAHADWAIWRIVNYSTPMNDLQFLEAFTLLTDAWSAYNHAVSVCPSYSQREGLEELAEFFKRVALRTWKNGAEAAMSRKPK